ncbi:hypothetical protein E2562_030255 [Oryza meyeriana var. granulata]|uniref:No apical meristem-associated C-terminal domain-containing protein n=1 Tax=Oryza meyeriana var. granulata TaxID=110450 RepID=A0A6G1D9A3_9ORYZ|nr:hypothetical protein E2562_030255 [Oryza meyeriana var. granulata]
MPLIYPPSAPSQTSGLFGRHSGLSPNLSQILLSTPARKAPATGGGAGDGCRRGSRRRRLEGKQVATVGGGAGSGGGVVADPGTAAATGGGAGGGGRRGSGGGRRGRRWQRLEGKQAAAARVASFLQRTAAEGDNEKDEIEEDEPSAKRKKGCGSKVDKLKKKSGSQKMVEEICQVRVERMRYRFEKLTLQIGIRQHKLLG